mmetsp:Transcript_82634/g.267477  ORF Transcript_82634/g.267477 Transcript_82634/m.267477 type:complete len:394 (+) Transcript_82634:1776-2957(+)
MDRPTDYVGEVGAREAGVGRRDGRLMHGRVAVAINLAGGLEGLEEGRHGQVQLALHDAREGRAPGLLGQQPRGQEAAPLHGAGLALQELVRLHEEVAPPAELQDHRLAIPLQPAAAPAQEARALRELLAEVLHGLEAGGAEELRVHRVVVLQKQPECCRGRRRGQEATVLGAEEHCLVHPPHVLPQGLLLLHVGQARLGAHAQELQPAGVVAVGQARRVPARGAQMHHAAREEQLASTVALRLHLQPHPGLLQRQDVGLGPLPQGPARALAAGGRGVRVQAAGGGAGPLAEVVDADVEVPTLHVVRHSPAVTAACLRQAAAKRTLRAGGASGTPRAAAAGAHGAPPPPRGLLPQHGLAPEAHEAVGAQGRQGRHVPREGPPGEGPCAPLRRVE